MVEDSFEIAMLNFSKQLEKNKGFLDGLSSTGGRLEYFVGWFSTKNSSFALESDLLKLLADLKVNLEFDVYAE